jgi:hypothetical protein
MRTPGPSSDVHATAVSDVNKPAVHRVNNRQYITVYVGSSPLTLLLDSGSDITLLSQESWVAIGSPTLRPASCRPLDCQGAEIPVLGELILSARINDTLARVSCLVTKSISILGSDWISRFRLWDHPLSTICHQVPSHERTAITVSKQRTCFPAAFKRTLGESANAFTSLHEASSPPVDDVPLVSKELEPLDQPGNTSPLESGNCVSPTVVVRAIQTGGLYSTDQKVSLLHPNPDNASTKTKDPEESLLTLPCDRRANHSLPGPRRSLSYRCSPRRPTRPTSSQEPSGP